MLFAREQIQSFLGAHRPDEGWVVYHCSEDTADYLFLMYLPDCLREKYPDSLKSCSIGKEPTMQEIDRIALKGSEFEPRSESDPDEDLESNGWIGSLEIEWAGSPIHFCSLFTYPRLSYAPLVLIAARSTAALRNFLNVLGEYGRFRERGKRREILVVNGQNISVSAVGWEDVVLPPGMADDIRCNVEAFFRSQEKYRELARIIHGFFGIV